MLGGVMKRMGEQLFSISIKDRTNSNELNLRLGRFRSNIRETFLTIRIVRAIIFPNLKMGHQVSIQSYNSKNGKTKHHNNTSFGWDIITLVSDDKPTCNGYDMKMKSFPFWQVIPLQGSIHLLKQPDRILLETKYQTRWIIHLI